MRKGLKKFTVPYIGTYYDTSKVLGLKVVFAENEEKALQKVRNTFKNIEEPRMYAKKAFKWEYGDKTEEIVQRYWE